MTEEVQAIQHEYTENITCPYCGWEHGDSWEVQGNYGEYDCGRCDERFKYSRDIEVTYTTEKLEVEEK